MSGMIRPAPNPIIRFVVENFAIIPSDLRGRSPSREIFGLMLTAQRETENGVARHARPRMMKVSRWAANKSMGSRGNRAGMNVPTPEASEKVMNDRLKVAALTSEVVVSARYAFQLDKYIASPTPPITADNSIRKMSSVMPGMKMMELAISAPTSIMCLRP